MKTLLCFFLPLLTALPLQSAELPNILWITSEDNGTELGCYGDSYSVTPNIDSIAAKGLRYTNASSTAPVCAP
ncbi:MAG: sulfatase-like hydrolase/transferase, partial [Verrucomicrobiota bacterium]